MKLADKLGKLKKILRKMQSVVVAYSGGVDSSLLLKVAKDVLEEKVLAVIAVSETYPDEEIKAAEKLARKLKVKHMIIKTDELKNKNFVRNDLKRCFYCKNELFSKLKDIAKKNNMNYVVDGSNLDDLKDFRPGSLAAAKLGVCSPLKEAGLTKADIRQLSRKMGLPTWDKPSLACLSSRFPYGVKITEDKLLKVHSAEKLFKNLGFKQVRLRHHDKIARIEVLKNEIPRVLSHKKLLIENLKKLGYNYICLDLEGYRSGSLNEVSAITKR